MRKISSLQLRSKDILSAEHQTVIVPSSEEDQQTLTEKVNQRQQPHQRLFSSWSSMVAPLVIYTRDLIPSHAGDFCTPSLLSWSRLYTQREAWTPTLISTLARPAAPQFPAACCGYWQVRLTHCRLAVRVTVSAVPKTPTPVTCWAPVSSPSSRCTHTSWQHNSSQLPNLIQLQSANHL